MTKQEINQFLINYKGALNGFLNIYTTDEEIMLEVDIEAAKSNH